MKDFFKFPHTPHIAWLDGTLPRNDKLMSPSEIGFLLGNEIRVEEKIDGANVGISIDDCGDLRFQNRGQYLEPPYTGQFSRLNAWLGEHENTLRLSLNRNIILFGEWCAAIHSIKYDSLTDWFLAFDVYDRQEHAFWSASRRNILASDMGLVTVPEISQGKFSLAELIKLASTETSKFTRSPLEGIVVRKDSKDWSLARGKLVRTGFVQGIEEHWRRGPLRWNRLKQE